MMLTTKMLEELQNLVPELSGKMLEVSTLYSLGTSYDNIAEMLHISTDTVRTYLKRSIKALNLETYEALRITILLRAFLVLLNK